MPTAEQLSQRAIDLSKKADKAFMQLAFVLKALRDQHPRVLRETIPKLSIAERKAEVLVQIADRFNGLATPTRLSAIGWTKAGMIAGRITPDNAEKLLKMAETLTVQGLSRCLRGSQPERLRAMLLGFTDPELFRLYDVLVMYGAVRKGRGLARKEEALMRLVDDVIGKKTRLKKVA